MNLERMGYKQTSLTKVINGVDGSIAAKAGHRIVILAVCAQTDCVIGTSSDPSATSFRLSDGYMDSPLIFAVNTTVYLEGDGASYTVWYMYDEM